MIEKVKLLSGKYAILKHLGISDYLFGQFLQRGLPAIRINKRWFSHVDNLDQYFRQNTAKQAKVDLPENCIDEP